jgi:predicted transcriptional regulator
MEPQVSSIRRQILNIIREIPGITQKDLALKLPIKKQRTISYHIKNMEREGVLRLEKAGRETKCFIADNVIEIKQTGVVFKEIDDVTADEHGQEYSDSILRQM